MTAPVAGGGFDQCCKAAQAAVAAGNMLVVAADVVQAPNDKQQIEPTLDKLEALLEALGETEDALLADAGYFSGPNVEACEKAGVEAGDPRWAASRTIRLWPSASPRRRRRRSIRHRSRRWRIG